MAIIYGRPDSEIEILRRSPRTVEKFEDIATEHQKLKDGLAEEKKDFFEKVPSRITKEEQKLDKIKAEEKITEQKFDKKIKKLEELGTAQASIFDEYLIVAFDKKWINVFGGLPVFRIIIDDKGRLCLQSQVVRSGAKLSER